MTIDQLRVFCMVARRLNLSAIAAELGFTQSAISQQIIALEKSMKVRLFDRVGRRLELAPAGEELLQLAGPFVAQLDGLQDNLRTAKHSVVGRLAIGASSTPAGYVLPGVIGAFKHRYPRVEATLLTRSSEEALQLLVQRRVHLAFVEAGPARRWEGELAFRPFRDDELVLVAPPDMKIPAAPLKRKDLARLPLLLQAPGSGTRRLLLDRLAAFGLAADELNVVFELDHVDALTRAVEQGLGAAFVSRLALGELKGGAGRLRELRVEPGLDLRRQLYAVQRLGDEPARPAQVFADFFAKSAAAALPALA